MTAPLHRRINPFERIRSTEGKVFLLLAGLVVVSLVFDTFAPRASPKWQWIEAAAILIYIAAGTFGTMRIVARPVRRAKLHLQEIERGDYSRPVLTRRTDEFGDMLRGLDTMRQSLIAAITARDSAEQKYREIVERSVQGFYQGTDEGVLLAANQSFARLLGYASPEQLLAEPEGINKRLHVDPARRDAFMQQMHTKGFVTGFEAALRRRDGGVIWVTESARVVHDARRGRVYWEGFLDDITERKEAEQLKVDFVSFVTHQLRTPLSGIRWMLELVQQADSADEAASFIADAHVSAQRLIGLVNDLLDVARIEGGRLTSEPELVDLHTLAATISDELAPLSTAKHQSVEVTQCVAPRILADEQLLRQAVLNLISNAIKYTPDGGKIRLHVQADAAAVRLRIQDTGIGISETAQKRLFEKFYRADNAQIVDTEGTGLGLYLVRLIAERSGGSVTCESVEDAGSTFTLSLPIAGTQRTAA